MEMNNENIIILIPAYHPCEKIIDICENILRNQFKEIIVISDGNEEEHISILEKLEDMGITVLYHIANQGKGRALKTGFNYICLKYKDILPSIGVLTIDADGQHTQESIRICCQELGKIIGQRKWVFGCRSFKECFDENGNINKIPFRSKLGNEVTKVVLKFVYGLNLSDTQTGLRGFPGGELIQLLKIEGERYEYEMNQILYLKEENIELIEVPIETIYEQKNQSSHFNPLVDSWKIYKPILKYTMSSMMSVIIEYLIFILMITISNKIVVSNYLARICSAGFNFYTNKQYVFKSPGESMKKLIKYIVLCFVSINISTIGIYVLNTSFGLNVVLVKIVVDILLYFFNFIMQRKFVF